ncbi:bZIP transcription factor family protein [Rhynchospora pubera]|uniref:BZIP transcription factor family protein n=1 Tax=Rhynchospora pubera TaxID=906938 RepID=A0AAV8G807_9POAL|nr:bZIP transcription factor family protein [Rhynchospora pubera]
MANERTLVCGVQGSFHTSTKFFDEAESDYFGELEEALIHGDPITSSHGPKKGIVETARPPTLEIFPSWPMRHQHHQHPTVEQRKSEQSVESSEESGSVKDTANTTSTGVIGGAQSQVQCRGRGATEGEAQKGLVVIMANGAPQRTGAQQPPPSAPQIQYDNSHTEKKKIIAGSTRKDGKLLDAKTLRRLAQNREAARKSRLRKKAYVQQLETSRIRLQQLEHDLQRARTQGMLLAGCGASSGEMSSGAAMFNMDYTNWLEEEGRHVSDLRAGLDAHLIDNNLSSIVDDCITHYDTLFHLKARLAQTDAFHLLTGLWTSPAERCFMWMGGFRPSDLIKIVTPHLDPLTEQQVIRLCSLQQSSQQAEEALWQGFDQLHQFLSATLSSGPLSTDVGADVSNYAGLMDIAIEKISSLENFVRQADHLRRQTLHQLREILTTRQAARCLLAIGEYYRRLRALSSVWATRPREALIGNETASPNTVTDLQAIQQSQYAHYSAF